MLAQNDASVALYGDVMQQQQEGEGQQGQQQGRGQKPSSTRSTAAAPPTQPAEAPKEGGAGEGAGTAADPARALPGLRGWLMRHLFALEGQELMEEMVQVGRVCVCGGGGYSHD